MQSDFDELVQEQDEEKEETAPVPFRMLETEYRFPCEVFKQGGYSTLWKVYASDGCRNAMLNPKTAPVDSPLSLILKVNNESIDTRNGVSGVREVLIHAHLSKHCSNFVPRLFDAGFLLPRKTQTFLVMERFDMTLRSYFVHTQHQTVPGIVYIMYKMALALWHVHSAGIMHRDIKPQNILVNCHPNLKHLRRLVLADFGISRGFATPVLADDEYLTDYVVTLWYRAPELLLGDKYYTSAIDIWSLACVFVQLWNDGKPLFCQSTHKDQLSEILRLTGVPQNITEELSPGLRRDKAFVEDNIRKPPTFVKRQSIRAFLKNRPANARHFLDHKESDEWFRDQFVDLVDSMLQFCPCKRPDIDEVLRHPLFKNTFNTRHLESVCPMDCSFERLFRPFYETDQAFDEDNNELRPHIPRSLAYDICGPVFSDFVNQK